MTGVRGATLLMIGAIVAASPGAGAGEPAAPAPLPVRVEKGVRFSTAGGDDLKVDVAVPTTGGPYPAVLMLHGGAWRVGGRHELSRGGRDEDGKPYPSAIEVVAGRGYVAASADYRLVPKHKFPAQIQDARTAVRFLRANAKRFNLDPDRIGVMGFSAGGQLALLLGCAGPRPEFDGTEYPAESGRVRCVVSYFGPTEMSLYAATPGLEEAYMVPWLGKACRTDPAVYKAASPITYASKDAAPVLMVHGTADFLVPVIHSERMLQALRAAGAVADLVTMKWAGHGWSGDDASKSTTATLRFLDEHLKGKK